MRCLPFNLYPLYSWPGLAHAAKRGGSIQPRGPVAVGRLTPEKDLHLQLGDPIADKPIAGLPKRLSLLQRCQC